MVNILRQSPLDRIHSFHTKIDRNCVKNEKRGLEEVQTMQIF